MAVPPAPAGSGADMPAGNCATISEVSCPPAVYVKIASDDAQAKVVALLGSAGDFDTSMTAAVGLDGLAALVAETRLAIGNFVVGSNAPDVLICRAMFAAIVARSVSVAIVT